MAELKYLGISTVSIFATAGLSSARQLVDTTSNERYSFKDSTAEFEIISTFYIPAYPSSTQEQETKDDQSWYWSDYWQELEREADQDLINGNYEEFDNLDDFINSI